MIRQRFKHEELREQYCVARIPITVPLAPPAGLLGGQPNSARGLSKPVETDQHPCMTGVAGHAVKAILSLGPRPQG